MSIKEWMLLVIIFHLLLISPARGDSVIYKGDHGDSKYDRLLTNNTTNDDAKSLREMIQKMNPLKETSSADISELKSVRENLLKSPASEAFSGVLTKMLRDLSTKEVNVEATGPVVGMGLGMGASEAIADPTINVIDSHISQLISPTNGNRFQPDYDEMKMIANEKHEGSNLHNLLRENLLINSIEEEEAFRLGFGVEQWKVLAIDFEKTAIVGRTSNSILVAIGHGATYKLVTSLELNIPPDTRFHFETLKVFDSKLNRARNLVLIALQGQLIWHELLDHELIEIHRWNLLKEIESLIHFTHDGSEILLLSTIDTAGKVQAEFIEFNVPDSEFWVIQAFALPERSPSMSCLDLGGDVIVAFVQNQSLAIYRHQFTKHLRGKFVHFKTIRAPNVTVVSGFRIGGHSYLAIGGDQPQILRYFNGDFHQQTILSQSFGFVEEFLPIPIRTYRDDLVLLVQHRLDLISHTLAVVDALVWNGIAFENAMSVPCHILADPNANGFTCMLDAERDDGFLGAAFIHHEKENCVNILIPRKDAHSGLFRVNFTFIDAEDPLMKEMDQMKQSIELINQMLNYEETVQEEVEAALKRSMDPNNDYILEGLTWIDELQTDFLELNGNVELENNAVEFIDSIWTQEDFLVNLDQLEAMITADEQKLRMIDEELNNLNRIHRQAPKEQRNQDSPIINIGSYNFNGQIEPKTLKLLPSDHARLPRQKKPEPPQIHTTGFYTFNGQLDPETIKTLPQPEASQRTPRQVKPIEESKVAELNVKNLQVETINGIPFSELIFLDNGQLVIPNRNISFLGLVEAENVNMLNNGRVNGIDFSHEVLAVQSPNPSNDLMFENVIVQSIDVEKLNDVAVDKTSLETIDLPTDIQPNLTAKSVFMRNNLNVEKINGINWSEFEAKLIPKHKPASINEITVEGDVWVVGAGELNTKFLNKLPFSEGFVLTSGPRDTVITGKKIFAGEVLTNAIDTDGEIDGIEPVKMITLDQLQEISAETTFKSLEVVRKLEVNGTIAGKELQEFLPNPTLTATKTILAACNFKELVVEGKLTIEETMNWQKFETILADVIYETGDDSEVIINAPKSFLDLEINGDVKIDNNLINDVNLDNIMMTDRDQMLSFKILSGDILITNLNLTGLFDSINATELEHNSFRTFGDQFIETPIIIRDNRRVDAAFADIKTSLNEIPVGEFMFIDQPINLVDVKNVLFNELKVEDVILSGNIDGPGTINLNFTDIILFYLSKSRFQEIWVPTNIKSLTTNGTFNAKSINGMDFNVFKNYMHGIKNFKNLILSGEQKLDNLVIDGSVNLKRINGKDFNQIVQNVIWLNRPNTVEGKLKFLDDVIMNGAVTVREKLNKKQFKVFAENWISNQEKSIKIKSDKIFSKNVMVEEKLETESINGIKFEDLLMVKDAEYLPNLIIHGNVNAGKLTIEGILNEKIVKNFENIYSYDTSSNTHNVKTDVHFNQQAVVDYLNTPLLNQINVSMMIANLIKKDESNVAIVSEKIFANQVVAQQGIYADFINDIGMDYLEKIILANDPSLVNINGDLIFTGDVYAQLMVIKGELYTRYISNCDIKELNRLALPIAKDVQLNGVMHINSSAFKPTNFRADYLNGLPLTKLFTLKTNQTFEHQIKVLGCLEVSQPLIVHGPVNGFFIEHERSNTVMRNEKHQVVSLKTLFGAARVYGPMTTYGKVNSKDLQNIVLLNSSPTIESAITFKSLEGSSLYTNNLISGTNFDKWYDNVLWNQGKDKQTVSGNWRVKKLRVTNDVTGNGLINDFSINEIERNLNNSINTIGAAISDYAGKYQELCQILGVKGNKSKNAIHILKHLELEFKLQETQEIFSYFTFRTLPQKDYIAVNTNCTTQLYKWHRQTESFKYFSQVVTGVVYNWAVVNNLNNEVFVITNSRMEAGYPCTFGGLNVWKMNDDQMFHVNTIKTGSDVLELYVNPQLPGRFFTLTDLDTVEHFDVFGEKKEFWQLPSADLEHHHNYSFIPSEVISDLTLFDGQKLFMLESKFKKRQARFLFNEKGTRLQGRNGDSPILRVSPALSRQFTLPSIPSKPLFQVDTQMARNNSANAELKNDYVTKIQRVHDAFQKSLSDTLSKVPKLKIIQVGNEKNQKNSESKSKEPVKVKEEPVVQREKSVKLTEESTTSAERSVTTEEPQEVKVKEPVALPKEHIEEVTTTKEPEEQRAVTDNVDPVISSKEQSDVTKEPPTTNSDKAEEPKEPVDVAEEQVTANSNKAEDSNEPVDVAEGQVTANSNKAEDSNEPVDVAEGQVTANSNKAEDSNEPVDVTEGQVTANSNKAEDSNEPVDVAEEQDTTNSDKAEEHVTQSPSSSEAPSKGNKLYFIIRPASSNTEAANRTAIENPEVLKNFIGKALDIGNALNMRKEVNNLLPDSSTEESSAVVGDEQVTSDVSVEPGKDDLASTEATDVTETSSELSKIETTSELIKGFESQPMETTEENKKLPILAVTPKILFPSFSEDEKFLENEFPETTKFPEVVAAETPSQEEQRVPHEVLIGSGLKETENPYFPEQGAGEFVMMYVGPRQQKKVLYAVTRTRDSIIKGNHNIIEIYNDIFEGSIYQYIHCTDPSNLVVLQFRDETLFAFLESRSEIHVYIYRGIQGFVSFKRIKLPGYAVQMTSVTLPPKIDYKCDRHYLLVRMETEIIFYGVKISGNCGIDEVNCEGY